MGYYILMLENGQFVSYEQISDKELEVVTVSYPYADKFPTLKEAQDEAKAINKGESECFKVNSILNVEAIMEVHDVE